MTSSRKRNAAALAAATFIVLLSAGCGSKHPSGTETTPDTTYNVEVRFYGPPPSDQVRAAFEAARGRIQAMVTADLAATNVNNVNLAPDSVCGVPSTTVSEVIDDIVIYATVKTIDGLGKVQASSGPCLVRSSNKLPVVGRMEMDVDDLNQLASTGRLNAVVLHEMFHVLGFGTIWDQVATPRLTGAGGADPRFTGPLATQACVSAGGSSICSGGVPVENCVGISGSNCGTGTRDAHWRETTFRTELMTGFVEASNVFMPLSAMTVQSMADLGYTVTTSAADPYQIPGTAIMLPDEGAETRVPWEETRRAAFEVTADGRISRRR